MPAAPRMYDVGLDEERDVTQADVDQLLRQVHVMGRHRAVSRVLEQMCHDAIAGDLPIKDYYRILGSIENVYTSQRVQQAMMDQAAGRQLREARERGQLNG